MTSTDSIQWLATGLLIGLVAGGLIVRQLLREGASMHSPLSAHRPMLVTQAGDHASRLDAHAPPAKAMIDSQTGRVMLDWQAPTVLPDHRSVIEFRATTPTGPEVYQFKHGELKRFITLTTPRRAEWRGDFLTYSRCIAWARTARWVVEDGRGVKWSNDWRSLARRVHQLRDRHDVTLA